MCSLCSCLTQGCRTELSLLSSAMFQSLSLVHCCLLYLLTLYLQPPRICHSKLSKMLLTVMPHKHKHLSPSAFTSEGPSQGSLNATAPNELLPCRHLRAPHDEAAHAPPVWAASFLEVSTYLTLQVETFRGPRVAQKVEHSSVMKRYSLASLIPLAASPSLWSVLLILQYYNYKIGNY